MNTGKRTRIVNMQKSDIEIEDLSTIVEIDMKDFDTPSILRKKK